MTLHQLRIFHRPDPHMSILRAGGDAARLFVDLGSRKMVVLEPRLFGVGLLEDQRHRERGMGLDERMRVDTCRRHSVRIAQPQVDALVRRDVQFAAARAARPAG